MDDIKLVEWLIHIGVQLKENQVLTKDNLDDIRCVSEQITSYVENKENLLRITNNLRDAIGIGDYNLENQKNWWNTVENLYASALAVRFVNYTAIMDEDMYQCMLNLFQQQNLSSEIQACGLYNIAQTKKISNPEECYNLSLKAYSIYPKLSEFYNVMYTYDKNELHETYSRTCPFCNSEEYEDVYCAPQVIRLNNKKGFSPVKLWKKCKVCENIYSYNFPVSEVENINGHYTVNKENETLKHNFSLSLYNDIFKRISKLTKGKNYLEIGIGTGEMLAVALEFGFEVHAVEICKEDAERVAAALDVHITCCDIVDYQTEDQYDVIVMGDVLEHVTNPFTVLEKVKQIMTNDSVLWISTPNYNSSYAKMEKFNHCMWYELNHYTYMSKESLEKILNQLGLEIIEYDMSTRYIGSMELCIKQMK